MIPERRVASMAAFARALGGHSAVLASAGSLALSVEGARRRAAA